MTSRAESAVREFCAAWGDGSAASSPDVPTLLSKLAPDAYWHLWVPGGRVVRGRRELEAEIRRQVRHATHQRCEIVKLVAASHMVFTERVDSFHWNGVQATSHVGAMFELNDAGQITAWREYFDMVNVARQLGVDPAVLEHPQGEP